jgi:hypothetical protein
LAGVAGCVAATSAYRPSYDKPEELLDPPLQRAALPLFELLIVPLSVAEP